MDAITINEERGHEVERKQGGVYGRAWREEREGGVYVITSKIREIKKGERHKITYYFMTTRTATTKKQVGKVD